jgi:hypothetical protein
MTELEGIPAKYVAAWHEPDADLRQEVIDELWAQECSYHNSGASFRGRSGIAEAVTEAHDAFIKNGFVFTVAKVDVAQDAVRYQWEMVPEGGGDLAAVGTHVFTVDGDGRIVTDHQFVDMAPAQD